MAAYIAAILLLFGLAPAIAQSTPPSAPDETSAQSDACNHHHQFYPPAAVRDGREGTTVLRFRIGTDGRTKNVMVVQSSGSADLDEAAVEGARCWRYKPATRNGQPVEIDWTTKVNWQLTKSKSWLDRIFK
jgi:periplasmic protein TonB